jgi:hypothetical protein
MAKLHLTLLSILRALYYLHVLYATLKAILLIEAKKNYNYELYHGKKNNSYFTSLTSVLKTTTNKFEPMEKYVYDANVADINRIYDIVNKI